MIKYITMSTLAKKILVIIESTETFLWSYGLIVFSLLVILLCFAFELRLYINKNTWIKLAIIFEYILFVLFSCLLIYFLPLDTYINLYIIAVFVLKLLRLYLRFKTIVRLIFSFLDLCIAILVYTIFNSPYLSDIYLIYILSPLMVIILPFYIIINYAVYSPVSFNETINSLTNNLTKIAEDRQIHNTDETKLNLLELFKVITHILVIIGFFSLFIKRGWHG